jgi:DNA-binding Lrp family transcriptional regulator
MQQIDRRILTELKADVTLPLARLVERVGLWMTPAGSGCRSWNRPG